MVHVERPIMRLPNLAIHLNREMGTEFKWNKETNLYVYQKEGGGERGRVGRREGGKGGRGERPIMRVPNLAIVTEPQLALPKTNVF